MNFNKYKISEVGSVITGKTPPTKNEEYFSVEKDKYLFITPRDMNINSKYISETERYLTDFVTDKFSSLIIDNKSICVSCIGTVGKVFIPKQLSITNQQINSITNLKDFCNFDYLYYYLKQNYKKIQSVAGGTTMPIVNKSSFEGIEIELPSLSDQLKIVKILNKIDEKIELNNEINNNLSEQIKSIYNEIFTEFIDYKRLDEISNVTIGKTPPRSEQECFTTDKNDVKWISISDLGKSGMFIFDTSEKLTQEAVDKYNVKVIPKDTVILSFKLTVGRTGFTTEDMTTNEAIAHFDLNNKELNNYLYCTLTYYNYSDLGSTSSIATAINSKIVKSIKIGIPSDEQLNKFNNLTSAMFKTIKNNESENIKLSELRDTILPKLMNGEIDLDKIEL